MQLRNRIINHFKVCTYSIPAVPNNTMRPGSRGVSTYWYCMGPRYHAMIVGCWLRFAVSCPWHVITIVTFFLFAGASNESLPYVRYIMLRH